MKNRSVLISVCNELKDSRCINFFPANTSNDELEIHVQISRHGVLDYQGGYWGNKTHKVPGIFAVLKSLKPGQSNCFPSFLQHGVSILEEVLMDGKLLKMT